MRVLIVTHNYLSGFGGGVYGARAYINAFAALYDDVTLLYPVQEGNAAPTEISPRVRMIGVADPVPDRRRCHLCMDPEQGPSYPGELYP